MNSNNDLCSPQEEDTEDYTEEVPDSASKKYCKRRQIRNI